MGTILIIFLLFSIGKGILDTRDSSINADVQKEINVNLVQTINNSPGVTWEASLNSMFIKRSEEELSNFIGVMNEQYAREDALAELKNMGNLDDEEEEEEADAEELPKAYSAAKEYPHCRSIRQIRDQGPCGGCWAMAAIEMLTDRLCIHYAKLGIKFNPVLSYRQMLLCGPGHGCHGGSVVRGIKWASEHGLVTGGEAGDKGTCLPGPFLSCSHHVQGTKAGCIDAKKVHMPACDKACASDMNQKYDFKEARAYPKSANYIKGEKKMMREIKKNGPIAVSFECGHDFFFYSKGIYKHVAGKKMGVHATRLIGWGETKDGQKYWIMTNSWNPEWGLNGVILFKRGENHMDIESSAVKANWGDLKKTLPKLKIVPMMKGADLSGKLQKHAEKEISSFDKPDWEDKRQNMAVENEEVREQATMGSRAISQDEQNKDESLIGKLLGRFMTSDQDFEEDVEEEVGDHGPEEATKSEEEISVDPFDTFFEREAEVGIANPVSILKPDNFWGSLLSFLSGFLVSCCLLGCCLRYFKNKTDADWIPAPGWFEGDTYNFDTMTE